MLAAQLGKPILLEGEAGVGKTDVAKVLARVLDTELIRLQCYEGLDANSTIYEWNYSKQILRIRMAEQFHEKVEALDKTIFSDEFLLSRPLLRAVRHPGPRPVVLLIDEVDRADEEFEAFLLEVLSDFQVTVPEIGTFTAQVPPVAVLTSNRTRELNDALKRRCLYLWIDYPTPAKEREIVMRKVPGIETRLAEQVAAIMHTLREVDFYKRPGIAETLDWSRALVGMRVGEVNGATGPAWPPARAASAVTTRRRSSIESSRRSGTASRQPRWSHGSSSLSRVPTTIRKSCRRSRPTYSGAPASGAGTRSAGTRPSSGTGSGNRA